MLQHNLKIIGNRWPSLGKRLQQTSPCHYQVETDSPEETLFIDGIHLSSGYNRRAEAAVQAALIPVDTPKAWLYGFGTGDLAQLLLERKTLQRLMVVILNPQVALAALCNFDHSAWLSDPRVELLIGTDETLGTPLAAVPACLQLADENSARLRDLVALELETPYLRSKHSVENPEINQRIKSNEPFIKNDGDVRQLFASNPGATIMVAAAGPSLGQNIARLMAHRDRCPLIAVNSALKPLAQAGITPDVAITIDADPKIQSCFTGDNLQAFASVPMVYFPRVPQQVLTAWPGPRLTAYAEHSSYAEISQKYPRGKLFSSGSVLHPAVDLAVQMGAAEIILFGADLAFPGGQKYTQGAGWGETDQQSKRHWVLDGHGNRVDTIASFRAYLRDLESYIARQPHVRFYNCSRDGAAIQGARFWEDKA